MSVAEYLDQLRSRLRGADRDLLLAEAEDHLRDTVTAGLAAGLTQREAEEAAISAFGSIRAVVRAHRARRGKVAVLADVILAAWKLGSTGLIAVGASGIVAALFNHLNGPRFIGAAPAGARYPAASCQYWLSIYHHVHTCAQAAMLENSADAVSLRLLAGGLGLVLLGVYAVVRLCIRWTAEQHPRLPDPDLLSRDWFPALTALGSGGAALLMTVLLATRTYLGVPVGPGFFLSGIIAALAFCGAAIVTIGRRHQVS